MLVLSVLLSTFVLLLTAMYAQFRWKHRHVIAAAAKLPCPPALPLLGNALLFIGGYTSSLIKNMILYTNKFKGTFCIWFGPVPVFVVSDPSDVQIVLNTSNTLEKDEVYLFLKPFVGNGLFTAPVSIWKKYRRIISPLLHPTNVARFLPIFNDVSRQLVTNLKKTGTTVDPKIDIFNASMDAITRAVITKNPAVSEINESFMHLLSSVGEMFTSRVFKVWLHIDWIFYFFCGREMKEATEKIKETHEVFDMVWSDEENLRNALPEAHLCQESERTVGKNMADLSLLHPDDDQEDHTWRDEVVIMVIGATDTVVSALTFLLLTLANNSYVQDKVYEEIQEVLGDSERDLTLRDVNSLKYLGQAIMESMRVHGVGIVVMRRATKDTKLSMSLLSAGSRILVPLHAMGWDAEQFPQPEKFIPGRFCTRSRVRLPPVGPWQVPNSVLPAGSRILVPLHAMGWNAEQFPQPEKFIPERFSTEYQEKDQNKRHNYAFLPFSGGPRNCIGKTYAMHIMKVVVVHILRKYKLTSQVRLEDIEYELKTVMFSKTPLLLDLEPRTYVSG